MFINTYHLYHHQQLLIGQLYSYDHQFYVKWSGFSTYGFKYVDKYVNEFDAFRLDDDDDDDYNYDDDDDDDDIMCYDENDCSDGDSDRSDNEFIIITFLLAITFRDWKIDMVSNQLFIYKWCEDNKYHQHEDELKWWKSSWWWWWWWLWWW